MHVAASALLQCSSIEAAAQVAGISTATLRRWRHRAEFLDLLAVGQSEIFLETCSKIRALGSEATEALAGILRSESALPAARVRAATAILGLTLRCHRLQEHEHRLERVEAKLQLLQRRGGKK